MTTKQRVYVSNLNHGCREINLEKLFKKFGPISKVSVCSDYGFVDFEDYRDADKAVAELDHIDFLGRRVRVLLAKRDRQKNFVLARRSQSHGERNRNFEASPQRSVHDAWTNSSGPSPRSMGLTAPITAYSSRIKLPVINPRTSTSLMSPRNRRSIFRYRCASSPPKMDHFNTYMNGKTENSSCAISRNNNADADSCVQHSENGDVIDSQRVFAVLQELSRSRKNTRDNTDSRKRTRDQTEEQLPIFHSSQAIYNSVGNENDDIDNEYEDYNYQEEREFHSKRALRESNFRQDSCSFINDVAPQEKSTFCNSTSSLNQLPESHLPEEEQILSKNQENVAPNASKPQRSAKQKTVLNEIEASATSSIRERKRVREHTPSDSEGEIAEDQIKSGVNKKGLLGSKVVSPSFKSPCLKKSKIVHEESSEAIDLSYKQTSSEKKKSVAFADVYKEKDLSVERNQEEIPKDLELPSKLIMPQILEAEQSSSLDTKISSEKNDDKPLLSDHEAINRDRALNKKRVKAMIANAFDESESDEEKDNQIKTKREGQNSLNSLDNTVLSSMKEHNIQIKDTSAIEANSESSTIKFPEKSEKQDCSVVNFNQKNDKEKNTLNIATNVAGTLENNEDTKATPLMFSFGKTNETPKSSKADSPFLLGGTSSLSETISSTVTTQSPISSVFSFGNKAETTNTKNMDSLKSSSEDKEPETKFESRNEEFSTNKSISDKKESSITSNLPDTSALSNLINVSKAINVAPPSSESSENKLSAVAMQPNTSSIFSFANKTEDTFKSSIFTIDSSKNNGFGSVFLGNKKEQSTNPSASTFGIMKESTTNSISSNVSLGNSIVSTTAPSSSVSQLSKSSEGKAAVTMKSSNTPIFSFGNKNDNSNGSSIFNTGMSKSNGFESKFSFDKKEEPIINTSAYSFGKTTEVVSKSNAISTFSFGGSNNVSTTKGSVLSSTESSIFPFGNKDKETTGSSIFSFGKSENGAPKDTTGTQFSFGKKEENKTKDSAFSFGKISSNSDEPKSNTSFIFGASSNASAIKATTSVPQSNKSIFSFGNASSTANDSKSFTFGNKLSALSHNTSNQNEESKLNASFASSGKSTLSGFTSSAQQPINSSIFSFNNANNTSNESKVLTFGNNTAITSQNSGQNVGTPKSNPQSSSIFSFGKSDGNSEKSIFNFGKSSSTPAPFQFGSPSVKSTQSSTFSFGNSGVNTTQVNSTSTSFQPSPAGGSMFNMGTNSNVNPPGRTTSVPSTFKFGTPNVQTNNVPPSFSFGNAVANAPQFNSTPQPATVGGNMFSIGASSNNANKQGRTIRTATRRRPK